MVIARLSLSSLIGVVGHWIAALRGGAARAHQPRIRLALRHVLRARHGEDRRLGGPDVVVDRERLEGGERTDDAMHVETLDQFLRLGARLRGIACGVAGYEFDRAAGELVVALLEERHHALFHLETARRERSGFHSKKTNLDGRSLRDGCGDFQRGRRDARRERALSTVRRLKAHAVSPSRTIGYSDL